MRDTTKKDRLLYLIQECRCRITKYERELRELANKAQIKEMVGDTNICPEGDTND